MCAQIAERYFFDAALGLVRHTHTQAKCTSMTPHSTGDTDQINFIIYLIWCHHDYERRTYSSVRFCVQMYYICCRRSHTVHFGMPIAVSIRHPMDGCGHSGTFTDTHTHTPEQPHQLYKQVSTHHSPHRTHSQCAVCTKCRFIAFSILIFSFPFSIVSLSFCLRFDHVNGRTFVASRQRRFSGFSFENENANGHLVRALLPKSRTTTPGLTISAMTMTTDDDGSYGNDVILFPVCVYFTIIKN